MTTIAIAGCVASKRGCHVGRLFGLAGAVGASLLVLAAPAVANEWRPIGSGAVATVDYVTGGGRRVSVDFRAPPAVAGGDARHIGRIIDVSPTSVRALSRQALRFAGPAGVALSVGMSAHDLLFDDDDIQQIEEGEISGYVEGYGWRMTVPERSSQPKGQTDLELGQAYFRSYSEAVAAYANKYCHHVQASIVSSQPPGQAAVWGSCWFAGAENFKGAQQVHQLSFEAEYCIYNTNGLPCAPELAGLGSLATISVYSYSAGEMAPAEPETYPVPGVAVPASAEAVNEAIPDSLLAQVIAEAIRNGYAVDAWTELAAAIAELNDILDTGSANYDAALDAQTIEGTTVVQAGQQTASSGGMSGEWPGFCSWATIVCTLADWVMGESVPPEDPELPAVQVETYDVITVGGGSYSCPSPTSLGSALGQPLVFSWQTACDFSVAAKPVVLLGSLLAAALVLVGVRQTGGGV